MKTSLLVRILVLSGIAAFGNVASASDQLASAFVGAGTGAVIGNAINRQDGAVVGGILGAIIGVAIADNDDRRKVVLHRAPPPPPARQVVERPRYQPVPVVAYPAPRPRYVAQPVFVDYRYVPRHWGHEAQERNWREWSPQERREQGWDREQDHGSAGRGNHEERRERSRW